MTFWSFTQASYESTTLMTQEFREFDDLGGFKSMKTWESIRFDDLGVLKERFWSFARSTMKFDRIDLEV